MGSYQATTTLPLEETKREHSTNVISTGHNPLHRGRNDIPFSTYPDQIY